MSQKDLARRTAVEIAFDGVDISSSIRPYLLSVTYVDNEEDAADDIQIKLQDRDNVWMEEWLAAAVDAAAVATAPVATSSASPTSYKVTPKIGLNVRSGPSTSYKKLGALVCGTVVEVTAIESGWASIQYNGKAAYVSAQYLKAVGGGGKSPGGGAASVSSSGMKIQSSFLRQNWNGDGKDKLLDCGQFELDDVSASGPPAIVTIKGTSLPFTSQVRQTEKSRVWEGYKFSGIVQQIADENGMTALYESDIDPYYERVEQFKTSDIAFLSRLCHDAGASLKTTNNIIVVFDQAAYEAKPAVRVFRRGDGSYTKYKLNIGAANTKYSSCRVRYTDPTSGKVIEAVAYAEDYKADAKNNQQLEVTAKVTSIAEAQTLAAKRLRLHNKYAKTATLTLPGDPDLLAGVTVILESWGLWDGKYIISQSRHTVNGSGGYETQITLRRVLEGY